MLYDSEKTKRSRGRGGKQELPARASNVAKKIKWQLARKRGESNTNLFRKDTGEKDRLPAKHFKQTEIKGQNDIAQKRGDEKKKRQDHRKDSKGNRGRGAFQKEGGKAKGGALTQWGKIWGNREPVAVGGKKNHMKMWEARKETRGGTNSWEIWHGEAEAQNTQRVTDATHQKSNDFHPAVDAKKGHGPGKSKTKKNDPGTNGKHLVKPPREATSGPYEKNIGNPKKEGKRIKRVSSDTILRGVCLVQVPLEPENTKY